MTQKHVAKSGASAGQWVTCTAQQSCRNGGRHLDSNVLKEISEKTYTPVKNLTEADVETYYADNPVVSQSSDQYLSNDNSLSLTQKRDILNRQLEQVKNKLENKDLSECIIRKDSENNTLSFTRKQGLTSYELLFIADPDDKTKFNSVFYLRNTEETTHSYHDDAGRLHSRDGKPAKTSQYYQHQEIAYANHGKIHRDGDEPARLQLHEDGRLDITYAQNGALHRDGNQPALISGSLFAKRVKKSYYEHGKLIKTEYDKENFAKKYGHHFNLNK